MKTCVYVDEKKIPKNLDPLKYNPWIVCQHPNDFCDYIRKHPLPDMISLNHDFADEHYIDFANHQAIGIEAINYDKFKVATGLHLMRWLIHWCMENDLDLPVINVHSENTLGTANMVQEANAYYKHRGQSLVAGSLPLQTNDVKIITDAK